MILILYNSIIILNCQLPQPESVQIIDFSLDNNNNNSLFVLETGNYTTGFNYSSDIHSFLHTSHSY